ncbi:MAG: YjbQ family protein, partial [Candidatus Scalindua sp.]|nr:YjbQ family protein [Candidatus Scalindua sp.]
MNVITDYVEISTRGHTDIIDITPQVEQVLMEAELERGNLTVFV